MPHRPTRAALLLALAAVLATACGNAIPDLDVYDVAAATAPSPYADLEDAGWPEAAAWIRAQADAGRPTVLNLFASWCGPCKAEAPVLRAAIAAHPDVAFLGVAHLDLEADARAFLEEEALRLPTLLDLGGDIAVAVGSRGLPTTAFFDHEGRLVYLHLGVLTEPLLAARLADLEAAARAARAA